MRRYTKMGEWVLDPFAGSGTTLIECKRLGRNGLGVELNEEVCRRARQSVKYQVSDYNVSVEMINGNAQVIDLAQYLKEFNFKSFQFILIHPPYHDIIKFSDKPEDLSNAKDVPSF